MQIERMELLVFSLTAAIPTLSIKIMEVPKEKNKIPIDAIRRHIK